MPITPKEWHKRFKLQSQWTKSTREYLFQGAGFSFSSRVLDVGCGTGAISGEISQTKFDHVVGIDLNIEFIRHALTINSGQQLNVADAHSLPFKNDIFGCTFCHFLLMWVSDPAQVIREMKRVTSPGGSVLALAEPDYGGRIDYPEQLAIINEWQIAALKDQGANPFMGRKIKALFHQAGLDEIEVGVIGAQWTADIQEKEILSEWEIIRSDLMGLSKKSEVEKTADEIQKIDQAAWALGERILFVPTFYALGMVR
jgi:ubiquinone/menaquinone biosynthesis C-methylase UbiE